jgi:hypothetical protein
VYNREYFSRSVLRERFRREVQPEKEEVAASQIGRKPKGRACPACLQAESAARSFILPAPLPFSGVPLRWAFRWQEQH